MCHRCGISSFSRTIIYFFLLVFVSFPPLIGHTTLITLCGFAYGMPGFYIGATASIIGSALAFITLRFLFSEKLHAWSSQNDKWQALEEVVVNDIDYCIYS